MGKRGLVIFDMDGTLLWLPVNWDRVYDRLRSLFKSESAFSPLMETVRRLAGIDRELLRQALKIIEEEEKAAIPRLEVLEGSKELLGELKARGYHLVLVTLQGEGAAMMALRKSGLVDFFEKVVTRNVSLKRLDQILEAKKGYGGRAVMVGDKIDDATSAMKAGCLSILVKSGDGYVSEADLVVESLGRDMKSILWRIDEYLK